MCVQFYSYYVNSKEAFILGDLSSFILLASFYQNVNSTPAHIPGDICPILFFFYQDVNSKHPANIPGDICPILFSFYKDVNSKETFILGTGQILFFLQFFNKMLILLEPTFLGIYVQFCSSFIKMSILKKPLFLGYVKWGYMSNFIFLTGFYQDVNFIGTYISEQKYIRWIKPETWQRM